MFDLRNATEEDAVDTPVIDTSDIIVRTSTEEDVPSMVEIYSHHIRHGLGTFDPEPLHDSDIKRRRKTMMKRRLPHLVAEHGAVVVGYAYAVPFRKRPAYRYAVKHSIYVHPDHLHAGIGRLLLPALIEACTAEGFRQMIGYVDAENIPSQKLHASFGFHRVGLLEGVGFKFGRWSDTLLMQRALGAGASHPPQPDRPQGPSAEIDYSRTT
jgi:phosphinothricin acetyltransferase